MNAIRNPATWLLMWCVLSIVAGSLLTGLGAVCIADPRSAFFPLGVVLLYPAFVDAFHLGPFPRSPATALILTALVWSVALFAAVIVMGGPRGTILRRGLLLLVAFSLGIAWELQPTDVEGCWNARPAWPCLCDAIRFVRFEDGRACSYHARSRATFMGRYERIGSGLYRLKWYTNDETTIRVFRHLSIWTGDDGGGGASIFPRLRITDEVEQILEPPNAEVGPAG
jgi:hypothetical protein